MKTFLLLSLALAFSMPVFSQQSGGLTPAQIAELDKIFAPARKSFQDALKKKDVKKLDAWQADLKSLAQITDYEARKKAAAEMQTKYAAFFKAAYAAAKIDESAYKQTIFDFFKKIGWLPTFGQFLTFTVMRTYPMPTTGAGSDCQFLKCPFSVEDIDTHTQGWGIGYGFGEVAESWVTDECGITSKGSVMVDGGCQQETAIGEYVEVKPNISKVEVSAKLPEYSFSGDCYPGFGSGYSYVACGISVLGEGLDRNFVLDEVVAYSPFGTSDQWYLVNKTNQLVKMAFNPKIEGGTYKIQIFGKTSVSSTSMGNAGSECIMRHPEDFKVCQIPK